MKRLVCSPSLTFLQPPADTRRRLGEDGVSLLKLISSFAGEHPVDLVARLLREEARRMLRLPVHTHTPRAKRGPEGAGRWLSPRGPPG
jgi:hypothetical protein